MSFSRLALRLACVALAATACSGRAERARRRRHSRWMTDTDDMTAFDDKLFIGGSAMSWEGENTPAGIPRLCLSGGQTN